MLSTQPQFTFWNPNNSNVQPPLSPIQRQQQQQQQQSSPQSLVDNHVKKSASNEDTSTTTATTTAEFQRPPSSNTPVQSQQQISNHNELSKDTQNSTPRSPGACSNSSFHEDDTSLLSSPNSSMQASSPKQHHFTNASSVNLNNSSSLLNSSSHHVSTSKENNNNHASSSIKDNITDIFQKLLELGAEPERKVFVERLQTVWEEHSIQCRNLPNLSKQTLDLYKLYSLVRERGGFNETTRLKLWKEISATLKISNSANSAFIVKRKFVQFGIFHYECKYDMNGVDPIPLIIEMEKNSKKFSHSNKSGKSYFFCLFFVLNLNLCLSNDSRKGRKVK